MDRTILDELPASPAANRINAIKEATETIVIYTVECTGCSRKRKGESPSATDFARESAAEGWDEYRGKTIIGVFCPACMAKPESGREGIY